MSKGLFKQSVNAASWGYAGTVAKALSQMVALIVLARLLGPEQYGVFAVSVIVIGYANFFADMGVSLVQKKHISDEDIRFIVFLQYAVGGGAALLVVILAGLLSNVLGEPKSAQVIRLLALVIVFNSFSAVSNNLLRRDLDFKSIQIAQVTGYIVGYFGVGIPMAIVGFGVWSIAMAWVFQAGITASLVYRKTRHSLRPLARYSGGRHALMFNGAALTANMANWTAANADKMVISHSFAAHAVGIYSNAYNLLMSPVLQVLATMQQVLFTASSRLQGEADVMSGMFLALLSAFVFLMAPVFILVAFHADSVVHFLLGNQWRESAAIVAPFAVAAIFYLMMGLATPLLWGTGRVAKEMWIQIAVAALIFLAAWFVRNYGLAAVGWTVAIIMILRASVVVWVTCRFLEISAGEVLKALRPGILIIAMQIPLMFAIRSFFYEQQSMAVLVTNTALLLFLTVIVLAIRGLHDPIVTRYIDLSVDKLRFFFGKRAARL